MTALHEITKDFRFDAAHTLIREIAAEGSRRIHGHSYRAQVALRGSVDPTSGMVADMGLVEQLVEGARETLDHRFLDEINDLGPATMENLASWIWRKVKPECPQLVRVTVFRDSAGESCSYWGE
ncbi:6-carboxytetrahydropterin synthase [Sandaracinobacteroides saxicola]|uniref:6-carboxytetrahydropterin synthase n=1 Tax=Sandaracinobacteroides saxicola TaxID=2759707 RepID=UPI001FB0DB08|nr:6-carboxytetrahydropterin synthase [Sandaracinobacteroides saxicola]